jgi:hypothetical protein
MEGAMSAIPYRDYHLPLAFLRGPSRAPAHPRESIFRRIFAALERSRQRRLEREAGRFIAEHGGRVTDDLERQLDGYFRGGGFPPYRSQHPLRPFPDA